MPCLSCTIDAAPLEKQKFKQHKVQTTVESHVGWSSHPALSMSSRSMAVPGQHSSSKQIGPAFFASYPWSCSERSALYAKLAVHSGEDSPHPRYAWYALLVRTLPASQTSLHRKRVSVSSLVRISGKLGGHLADLAVVVRHLCKLSWRLRMSEASGRLRHSDRH